MESIPADINVLFVDGDAGVRSEAKKHLELADGRINVETAVSGEKSLENLETVTMLTPFLLQIIRNAEQRRWEK